MAEETIKGMIQHWDSIQTGTKNKSWAKSILTVNNRQSTIMFFADSVQSALGRLQKLKTTFPKGSFVEFTRIQKGNFFDVKDNLLTELSEDDKFFTIDKSVNLTEPETTQNPIPRELYWNIKLEMDIKSAESMSRHGAWMAAVEALKLSKVKPTSEETFKLVSEMADKIIDWKQGKCTEEKEEENKEEKESKEEYPQQETKNSEEEIVM